jgi:hypothetical protein
MQLVKATGAEVTHQDIEKLHIPEGLLEPVEQCGTWFIRKKCQIACVYHFRLHRQQKLHFLDLIFTYPLQVSFREPSFLDQPGEDENQDRVSVVVFFVGSVSLFGEVIANMPNIIWFPSRLDHLFQFGDDHITFLLVGFIEGLSGNLFLRL